MIEINLDANGVWARDIHWVVQTHFVAKAFVIWRAEKFLIKNSPMVIFRLWRYDASGRTNTDGCMSGNTWIELIE